MSLGNFMAKIQEKLDRVSDSQNRLEADSAGCWLVGGGLS